MSVHIDAARHHQQTGRIDEGMIGRRDRGTHLDDRLVLEKNISAVPTIGIENSAVLNEDAHAEISTCIYF